MTKKRRIDKTSLSTLITDSYKLELGILSGLKDTIENKFRTDESNIETEIEKEYDDPPDDELYHIEELTEEYWFIEDMERLFFEYLIVGLWRVVELNVKKIAKWYDGDKNFDRMNIPDIMTYFQRDGINISNIQHYDDIINELRELNNLIKHNGKIDKQFAVKYKGYKSDDEFSVEGEFNNLKQKFDYFIGRIPECLSDLAFSVKD